jgi:hypothetical protein
VNESISVPLSLFLWGAGLYVAAVVGLFSVIAHLCIRILTKVNEIGTVQAVTTMQITAIEKRCDKNFCNSLT